MKRLWLGLGLLLLLFGVGVAADQLSAHLLEPVCDDLSAASDAALAENWPQAEQLAAQARQQWESKGTVMGTVADHEPLEQINQLYAQLEVYAKSRDPASFAACCQRLRKMIEAVAKTHEISWENFL